MNEAPILASSDTETEVPNRINWIRSLPFLAIHGASFGVFFLDFSWKYVALCFGLYIARMFSITGGYHRYFSHRSYRMNRVSQFLMAFVGGTSIQKGALWWAANHRIHHRRSDQENDIHSPLRTGFWWSHVGWILSDKHNETQWDQIPDLAKFPELVWLNKHHMIPPVLLGVALFFMGGLPALVWGLCLSTVMLWHGTFTINSLSHVIGSRRYATPDTSRNNWVLALVTLGEGWHNNHHCYMSSTNQGFYWWEIDLSYYTLKALSWIGVARDLRKPPLHLLEAKRLDRGARDPMPLREDVGYKPTRTRRIRLRRAMG